jgi:hypothetical protein
MPAERKTSKWGREGERERGEEREGDKQPRTKREK